MSKLSTRIMKFSQESADVFVPSGDSLSDALSRTTHLAIGAHQDDLEFFAYHGIDACYGKIDAWFTGVTCTDGAGSPRTGMFEEFTDIEMQAVRAEEQRKAAAIGDYSAVIQLGHPSSEIKDASSHLCVEDLMKILASAQPEVVYLHNLADKHDTHVATTLRSIEALRRLPTDQRPAQVWGCEVWRGLDWLPDRDKVLLSASRRPDLQSALNEVYSSQIEGGKRYDLAVMGRRLANATFHESHAADVETGVTWAMDLSPLVHDEKIDIMDYTLGFVRRLEADVEERLKKLG